MRHLIALVAATVLWSAAPSAMAASGEYLCQAKLFDRTAKLWLVGDKPVRYQWHDRAALKAEMRGNVITIAASPPATLSKVVIGKTAKGQKVIKGNWKFKNNTANGVVFVCAAK